MASPVDDALLLWGSRFHMHGDIVKCVRCYHNIVASRADEPFQHRRDCPNREHRWPWRDLRDALAQPAKAVKR